MMSVEDAHATALGHVEGRTEVALAFKPMKHWISLYTLNPVLPAAFLRALARRAGVHIYNDADDTLYASRSYLALNADGADVRTIRLARPTDMFDALTGELLAARTSCLARDLRDKETLLLRFEH